MYVHTVSTEALVKQWGLMPLHETPRLILPCVLGLIWRRGASPPVHGEGINFEKSMHVTAEGHDFHDIQVWDSSMHVEIRLEHALCGTRACSAPRLGVAHTVFSERVSLALAEECQACSVWHTLCASRQNEPCKIHVAQ